MEVRKSCEKIYVFDNIEEIKKFVDIEKWKEENSEWLNEDISFSINCQADYITEFLEKNGFYKIEPCWRFSYRQGDGASFTAKWERPDRWLLKKWAKEYFPKDDKIVDIMERLRKIVDEYKIGWFKIGNNQFGWHYCHSSTKQIDDVEYEKDVVYEEVEQELEGVISDLISWFEDKLESIAYYEYTDDEIAQMIYENKFEIEEDYLKEIPEEGGI